nr:hypothetical protein L203_02177 [Cryptococcus depauperatus CBS 7841]
MLLALLPCFASVVVAKHYVNNTDYASGALDPAPYRRSRLAQWNINVYPSSNPPEGYIFMAPRREDVENLTTIIYTNDGEVVWHGAEFGINETMAVNLWEWECVNPGSALPNQCQHVRVSSSFASSGIDFREVLLITNKTVLVTIYVNEQCDLSSMGVTTTDGSNGETIFTWKSIDHINPIGCYNEPGSTDISESNPWHINFIEKNFEGNYLISSRYCHVLYLISASTGEILWTIGSKNSSFAMGDVYSTMLPPLGRVMEKWQEDCYQMLTWVTVSKSQGSIQQQSNSNYLVGWVLRLPLFQWMTDNLSGWGQMPFFSEYASDDTLISSVQFGAGNVQGYRILRQRWTAYPTTKLIIFVIHNSNNDQYEVYTSWNRATEIDQWALYGVISLSGSASIDKLNSVDKTELKTSFAVNGTVMGSSNLIALSNKASIPALSLAAAGVIGGAFLPKDTQWLGDSTGVVFVMMLGVIWLV